MQRKKQMSVWIETPTYLCPTEVGKVSGWVRKKKYGYQIMWDICQTEIRLLKGLKRY